MKKTTILLGLCFLLALVGVAGASSRYLITSVHEIKPSVLAKLRGQQGPKGNPGANGVVPALVTVDSAQITLQPGQTSFGVDPTGFQATCPSGDYVLGTGYYAAAAFPDFVINYSTFVGGFFENDSSIATQVYLQATCGQVPGGSAGANIRRYATRASANAAYRRDLLKAAHT